MSNCNALLPIEPNQVKVNDRLGLPPIDLSQLPIKMSKRLWVSPGEFIEVTSAWHLAHWALNINGHWRKQLLTSHVEDQNQFIKTRVFW